MIWLSKGLGLLLQNYPVIKTGKRCYLKSVLAVKGSSFWLRQRGWTLLGTRDSQGDSESRNAENVMSFVEPHFNKQFKKVWKKKVKAFPNRRRFRK